MKISIDWLKEYVAPGVSIDELAHKLTMAGLEVEHIEKVNGADVFEIEITPNRPDCLNVVGIAREVSAILNRTLKPPKIRKYAVPSRKCDIQILDRQTCARYIGTLIRGTNIKPAPKDIQHHLKSIGLRPINNAVDVTNFCLMESGQPLHVFDYDKLIGGTIIVRRARAGEKIVTFDGEERVLDPSILVIADAKRPVAVAGVIGGQATEVSSSTRNILLESAYFDPLVVRRAARFLGISTDSSYRFERGVDLHNVETTATRAAALIRDLTGGKIDARLDVFPEKRKKAVLRSSVSIEEINSYLGADLTASECKTILKKLGFGVTLENRRILHATAPFFRGDIHRKEDLIEEIARVIGYDNLPTSLPQIRISKLAVSNVREQKETCRRVLLAQGFDETINYAMTNRENLQKSRLGDLPAAGIQNPLTVEQEVMRPHSLPSLLQVVRNNINRGNRHLRLFEIGKIYHAFGKEEEVASLIMTGARAEDWRASKRDPVDYYDLKGVLSQLFLRFSREAVFVPGQDGFFQNGQAVDVMLEKERAGVCGKVDQEILNAWDIRADDLYFAQIGLSSLFSDSGRTVFYRAPSEFPAVTRDVSLAVAKQIAFDQVREIAFQNGGDLLTDLIFIEQYTGEKIEENQRALVFSLIYQSPERTLTEPEVNEIHGRICDAFVRQLNATIR